MTVFTDRKYGNAVLQSISGTADRLTVNRENQTVITTDRGEYRAMRVWKRAARQQDLQVPVPA